MAGKVKLSLELSLEEWAELKRAVEDTQKVLDGEVKLEKSQPTPLDHKRIESLKHRYVVLDKVIQQL